MPTADTPSAIDDEQTDALNLILKWSMERKTVEQEEFDEVWKKLRTNAAKRKSLPLIFDLTTGSAPRDPDWTEPLDEDVGDAEDENIFLIPPPIPADFRHRLQMTTFARYIAWDPTSTGVHCVSGVRGSGKTTLLNRILYEVARGRCRSADPVDEDARRLRPLLLRLDFGLSGSLEKFALDMLRELADAACGRLRNASARLGMTTETRFVGELALWAHGNIRWLSALTVLLLVLIATGLGLDHAQRLDAWQLFSPAPVFGGVRLEPAPNRLPQLFAPAIQALTALDSAFDVFLYRSIRLPLVGARAVYDLIVPLSITIGFLVIGTFYRPRVAHADRNADTQARIAAETRASIAQSSLVLASCLLLIAATIKDPTRASLYGPVAAWMSVVAMISFGSLWLRSRLQEQPFLRVRLLRTLPRWLLHLPLLFLAGGAIAAAFDLCEQAEAICLVAYVAWLPALMVSASSIPEIWHDYVELRRYRDAARAPIDHTAPSGLPWVGPLLALFPRAVDGEDLRDVSLALVQQRTREVLTTCERTFPGGVVVLLDDFDLHASAEFPLLLRLLRPFSKVAHVRLVVAVPDYFYPVFRGPGMTDLHSSIRACYVLGNADLFELCEERVRMRKVGDSDGDSAANAADVEKFVFNLLMSRARFRIRLPRNSQRYQVLQTLGPYQEAFKLWTTMEGNGRRTRILGRLGLSRRELIRLLEEVIREATNLAYDTDESAGSSQKLDGWVDTRTSTWTDDGAKKWRDTVLAEARLFRDQASVLTGDEFIVGRNGNGPNHA